MMTPHKSGGKGTYLLDRRFPGVGRVRRATGTNSRKMFGALNDMLSNLWANGRLDVLLSIRDGQVHPMQVWAKIREVGLDRLPRIDDMIPLSSMLEWAETFRASKHHRENVQSCIRILLATTMENRTVQDLANVLRQYRETARPRMFNVVRTACQAFLRDRFGRRHPLYAAVADVPALPYRAGKVAPLTKEAMLALELPQPLYGMAWSMALTGMGPGEYWGRWEASSDRVHVYGTKRVHRERIVPRISEPVIPACTIQTFRKRFKAATGSIPYALRHTFSHWLEAAGVPQSRIDLYMGHDARTVRQTYLWHEVEPHLVEDAEHVIRYLGEAHKAARLA